MTCRMSAVVCVTPSRACLARLHCVAAWHQPPPPKPRPSEGQNRDTADPESRREDRRAHAGTDATVTRTECPVLRYLHRSDVIRNNFCVTALGRTNAGPIHHKCGKDGSNRSTIGSGQVPVICARRT